MIEDPVHGLEMSFGQDDGETLVILTTIRPGGRLAEHFHIGIEEHWQVLAGTVGIKREGRWHQLTPNDGVFVVASGQRHAVRNDSDSEVRLKTVATPPRNLRQFIVESAWAAREGLFNRHGLPTGPAGLAWAAEFALRFQDETVVCRPPPALQRLLLPAAARLTRRLRPAGPRE